MAETLSLRGVLKGHDGWVTCIATSSELPNKILSGARLLGSLRVPLFFSSHLTWSSKVVATRP